MPSKIDASARKLAEFGNARSTRARIFHVAMRADIMKGSSKKLACGPFISHLYQ